MKQTALRLDGRRLVWPALCLCLPLITVWCGVSPKDAGARARLAAARVQSAELEEAGGLSRQVGKLYEEGRYAEAIPLAERVLAVREKALGPGHRVVALSLNDLAVLYNAQGDYARAEPLFQRSLAVREKALGPNHPEVAQSLNNLAGLYNAKSDHARAEPLLLRALSIYENGFGPDHPLVAMSLNNLAGLYNAKGDYARADPLYQRALAIRQKALGPDHPLVAQSLNNLAGLYKAKGDYARAEPLYLRALVVNEMALGLDHPSVATPLNNLAGLYKAKGDYARAGPLYQRALSVYERALGPEHPNVAAALNNLAVLYTAQGNVPLAVQSLSRGQEVLERNLSLILATGSERQKLAYLSALSGDTDVAVSLHARSAPTDRQAVLLSLTTILRRKGRALDAMSDQVASLRRRLDPQDRALLEQLSAAQSALAALVLGDAANTPPEGRRAAVSMLEATIERLQDSIGRRSAEFRVQARPVTIEQAREALPAGTALVEFFSYRPFDAKAMTPGERFGPARYIAYVLRGEAAPLWADLGEAADVDADITRLLRVLKCPQGGNINQCPSVADVKRSARAVDERVMRPVRRLLGETRRVFLAPDGALNLLPFGALVDEGGKYLVENYSLTYLTSGRDLLRLQLGARSRQPPLILADPLYGPEDGAGGVSRTAGAESGRRSSGASRLFFGRLPGTAEEAKALAKLLPQAKVLTRAQATEAALKQARAPLVLHVATHGFFLPDQPRRGTADGARGLKLIGIEDTPPAAQTENPLLRSGLALEGANLRQREGGEDGILTALEASALDLWGTKLVVLSACETGLGEVKNGEGVYGLRRALVLAGAESQVMTLWQVSDAATRDLMIGYYTRLIAGEGRTEALRRVQSEMLRSGGAVIGGPSRELGVKGLAGMADRSHPYFWAAFIQSGDWRGIVAPPASAK